MSTETIREMFEMSDGVGIETRSWCTSTCCG